MIPVAPAISPAIRPQLFHIPNQSDVDPPPFPVPLPPLAESVTRNLKSFKHRSSFDATFSSCDKPTIFDLQKNC